MEMQSVQGVYAQWTDQPVVLQVASASLRVPLRGIIVGETQQSVRFRIDDSWDIDIYKSMILAVEEDSWMNSIT
jgi:type II secretory pathway component PulC